MPDDFNGNVAADGSGRYIQFLSIGHQRPQFLLLSGHQLRTAQHEPNDTLFDAPDLFADDIFRIKCSNARNGAGESGSVDDPRDRRETASLENTVLVLQFNTGGRFQY